MNKYDLLELYELALDGNLGLIIKTVEDIYKEKKYKGYKSLKDWHKAIRNPNEQN